MPPKDFATARASNNKVTIVDDRPYFPQLVVTLESSNGIGGSLNSNNNNNNDSKNDDGGSCHSRSSILSAVLAILFHDGTTVPPNDLAESLKIKTITGGITNALYCVSGFSPIKDYDSVLLRVFGAEGMIDRDVETCTFAKLAESGIAPHYHGRFANGRVEGWLENYAPLVVMDFQIKSNMEAIAKQMARLHHGFRIPEELKEWHDRSKPGLWKQIFSWLEQAKKINPLDGYNSKGDSERAKRLIDLPRIEKELMWVKDSVVPPDSQVAFCHNDLLPANIMKHSETGEIRLIDFEYGGVNYVGFDIANHFNEFAGGTEKKSGEPDYSLFPDESEQRLFISAYVSETLSRLFGTNHDVPNGHVDVMVHREKDELESEIQSLLKQVHAFVLVNHLYWGLWAINQAATEGTEKFDYLAYAWHRLNRFGEEKERLNS
jgi:ethanolamine kinase